MKFIIQGYSIYQLLIALSIIGVSLSYAIPSFAGLMLKYNEEAAVTQLKGLIWNAQDEARRLSGDAIIVCAAQYNTPSNGTTNTYLNSCASSSLLNPWSEGILSYIDLNYNGDYNSGERIKALRFDNHLLVNAVSSLSNHTIRKLKIASSGIISDDEGNTAWVFSFSESKLGQTRFIHLRLNEYGHFCLVGDPGC